MNNNQQPKHMLAMIGFILSIVAIVFAFFATSIDETGYAGTYFKLTDHIVLIFAM